MTKKPASLLNDYHLLSCDELDSTNEEAKRLARGGGSHGAVVWAKRQLSGRGRYGRPWISQEGNLFVSVLLSPPCGPEDALQLSFVSALSALDAIAPLLPDVHEVACKWPNDILIDGRKVAGILLESFQHEGKYWLVVGLGVNVDSHPQDVMFPATSLREEGVEIISAKIVLSRFIHHFIERYNSWESKGFAPIRRDWLKSAWRLKQPLIVKLPHEEVEGVFRDIDAQGALVLQVDARKKRLIHTGDVFPLEQVVEAVG